MPEQRTRYVVEIVDRGGGDGSVDILDEAGDRIAGEVDNDGQQSFEEMIERAARQLAVYHLHPALGEGG